MCLRRAPEKYIAGAALDRAALECLRKSLYPELDSASVIFTAEVTLLDTFQLLK
jgi:hypothetical protein